MGSDFNYAGLGLLNELIHQHTESFGIVTFDWMKNYIKHLINNRRDFDILQENLGSLPSAFNLQSTEYVPQRMVQQINKAVVSMIESGLFKFYTSFTVFMEGFIVDKFNQMQENGAVALTMDQMKIPLIICFVLLVLASALLAIEITVYRVKIWSNRRQICNEIVVNQRQDV